LGVDVLHKAEVKWKVDGIEATIQQVLTDYKSWTSEKIAVALKLQSLYPEKNWTKLFAPTFKGGDILASTNLQALARILKVRSFLVGYVSANSMTRQESAIEEGEESA
jgi:DNA polymerase phi